MLLQKAKFYVSDQSNSGYLKEIKTINIVFNKIEKSSEIKKHTIGIFQHIF